MAYRFTDEGWDRWRFAGLGLAALLIVVVPSLLLLQLSRDSVNAANWVAHTQAVSTRLYVLQADIRDVESAALTMSKGVESDALRQRLRRADYIGQTLGELSSLVSDSPEQLVRIGRITSMLERRMALSKQIAESVDSPRQRQLIEEMTFSYPIRDIVVELQHHEEQLLTKRVAAAQRQQRLSTLVTWSTLAAQLLLLGLVLWLLKRQIGRRNRAEQRLLQASARAGACCSMPSSASCCTTPPSPSSTASRAATSTASRCSRSAKAPGPIPSSTSAWPTCCCVAASCGTTSTNSAVSMAWCGSCWSMPGACRCPTATTKWC